MQTSTDLFGLQDPSIRNVYIGPDEIVNIVLEEGTISVTFCQEELEMMLNALKENKDGV